MQSDSITPDKVMNVLM